MPHPRSRSLVAAWLTSMALVVASGLPAPASGHGGHAHSASPVGSVAPAMAERVTVTGELRRIHGHRGGSRAPVAGWLLTTRRGARIPLEFAPGVATPAGVRVRVSGIRRGAVLRVTRSRRIAGGASARASALPVGAKKTAVILFNFSDDRSRPFSEDDVRSALFTGPRSVSAFYAAESRGKLSLTGIQRPDGDVHGWYEISASGGECFGGANWDWYDKADAAARANGVDLSGYDHVVYVHPKVASCQFAGIASLGGGWSSLNGTIGLWVAGHEIGHNYEFEHAGRAYCKDEQGRPVAISDSCTVGEYDDPYDIMGNRFQRHSSGIRQLQARWIPAANARTVTSTSTYDLAPLAATTSAVQVLRVPRGDGRSYWLEFRRPEGVFDDFAATESVISGVSIRLAGSPADPGVSELIDTNPATARSARDEALGVGRTFVDARHRITITTEAAGPEGARVTVGVDVDAPAAVSGGEAPAPAPAAPAPPSAPAPTTTPAPAAPAPAPAAPAVKRVTVERAMSGARRLRVHRLSSIDGRGLTVGSHRARATLDLRYRPGADARGRTSKLDLRLRTPRACLADVWVRADGRSFARIARIAARRKWGDVALALPPGALGTVTDVRISCAGGPRQLTLDAAALNLR